MRLLAALFVALPLAAQDPAGAPKTRLELADTARGATAPRRETTTSTRPSPRSSDTAATGFQRVLSNSFVRNQTLLGFGLYGPSFAATVSNGRLNASAVAAYVVMAGGSFFAAAELSRDLHITEGMQLLATSAPLHGAALGAAIQYAATGKENYNAGIFFGSLLGTTGALTLGHRLSLGAAQAAMFGSEAAAAIAIAAMYASSIDSSHARARVGLGAAAGLAGMQLGAMYASYAPYTVTAGDVQTLPTAAVIGAAAAGTAIANGKPGTRTTTYTLLGGAIAGLVAGDRFLVRRYDHTRSEGSLVALGAAAGALMGGGVAVLVGSSSRFNATTSALGAVGAVGGVVMAERWLGAHPDAGRRVGQRLTVSPQGLALAASRVPGTYSLLSFSF